MPDSFSRMGLAAVRCGNRRVKKYFNSKIPRLVAMYLFAVTRETVDRACLWHQQRL
jgi:hypothetical protein